MCAFARLFSCRCSAILENRKRNGGPFHERDRDPALADARDYYSVPSLFFGGEKLYEAHFTHSYDRIKESIRAAFDKVLAA